MMLDGLAMQGGHVGDPSRFFYEQPGGVGMMIPQSSL